MYCLVFANGEFQDGEAVQRVLTEAAHSAEGRLVIAADGGLRHVTALGLRADVVIGDMDSAAPVLVETAAGDGAEVIRHPTEKNETDLELALTEAAARGGNPIHVLAALGGRFDQTISNVYLLTLEALSGRDVRIVSGRETIWLARPGVHRITGQAGDTLSLIPLSPEVRGIFTTALYYPLRGESLRLGPARGVSNVMREAVAEVRFAEGLLLLTHTPGVA